MKSLIIILLVAASCASKPVVVASPAQRSVAVQVLLEGGTTDDVAKRLSLDHEAARELIRVTLRDLNARFYSGN